jgi:hypothetical protein
LGINVAFAENDSSHNDSSNFEEEEEEEEDDSTSSNDEDDDMKMIAKTTLDLKIRMKIVMMKRTELTATGVRLGQNRKMSRKMCVAEGSMCQDSSKCSRHGGSRWCSDRNRYTFPTRHAVLDKQYLCHPYFFGPSFMPASHLEFTFYASGKCIGVRTFRFFIHILLERSKFY